MRWLDERTRNIMDFILRLSAPISLADIQERFSVSRRTVYTEMDRVSDWLRSGGFSPLEIVRGKLEPIGPVQAHAILNKLAEKEETIYVFSPQERVDLIICLVIARRERILISTLMDTLLISRTTLLTDLKSVQTLLSQYGLSLHNLSRRGYVIEGDEIRRRAVYLLILTRLGSIPKDKILFSPWKSEIDECYARLKAIERDLHCEYIDEQLYDLAALLSATYRQKEALDFSGLNELEIRKNTEYKIVSQRFPEFPEQEKMYITLHVLGSRLAGFPNTDIDSQDCELLNITDSLIHEFQNTACVEFDQYEQLRTALFHHIKASRYRYMYGIQIGCPLEKNVRLEYPEVFRITTESAKYLEQALQVQISESEIAYLALHFGAFLSLPKRNDTLRILIVCVSGVSAANMIAREVRQLVPSAQITGIQSLHSVTNPHLIADLIISSVDFQALIPVLKVHPIFTAEDRRNVLSHPVITSYLQQGNPEEIFQKIKDLVPKENHQILRSRLNSCFSFQNEQPAFAAEESSDESNGQLLRLLKGNIRFLVTTDSWQSSIDQASEPLLENGEIDPVYPKMIIRRCMEHGPYMFLNEEVMVAHAAPDDGVNSLCLSLAVYDKPASFGDHQARFVFVLGAVDQTTHFPVLLELRKLFKTKENRQLLAQTHTEEAFMETAAKLLSAV